MPAASAIRAWLQPRRARSAASTLSSRGFMVRARRDPSQSWVLLRFAGGAGRRAVRLNADLGRLHGDPDATPLAEAELVRRLPRHLDGEGERRAGEQPDARA